MLEPVIHWMESHGVYTPWLFLSLFIAASFLMIWRLEAMSAGGFEGTVLGTLVMPYCSGMGNLIFAFILGRSGGNGADVLTNSIVNNVTNLTLILGLPAIIWGINLRATTGATKGKKKKKDSGGGDQLQLNRLTLLLTLTAVFFFTGAVWALGRKGHLDFNDGLVLIGLFLFWQCFHVFEVLKTNVRGGKSVFSWMLPVDLALLAVGAFAIYLSTNWLVHWLTHLHTGFISAKNLGWLSGWLMVLPNAVLALYYGWRKKPDVIYTSQVGDAHISIPLCLGIFALFQPLKLPAFFQPEMLLLLGTTLFHFTSVALLGRLPRFAGLLLVGAYGWFLWRGLLG